MWLQDAAGWGLKLEALKLVQALVQFFSKLVGPHLPPFMAQAWHLFLASQPLYQQLVINSAPDLDSGQVAALLCSAHCLDIVLPHAAAATLPIAFRPQMCLHGLFVFFPLPFL